MTDSRRTIRKLAVLVFALMLINIFSLSSAFASYIPDPAEFTKTLDNGPVPPEYMGKFKIVIKDPEGNIRKHEDFDSPLTHEPYENIGNGGNTFFVYFDSIVYYYLKEKHPAPETKYVTFTVEEIPTDVPGIKYDKTVYTVKCYFKVYPYFAGRYSFDLDYVEINGNYYTYNGVRLTFNPDGSRNYTGDRNGFISFNNTTIKYVTHTVKKIWKNGSESSAKAQLYKDGTAYGTPVELNATNNWSYTWNNLDDSYTWTVKELDVPAGYSTKSDVSTDGKTTTITNTKVNQPASSQGKNVHVKSNRTVKTGDNTHLAAWLVVLGTVIISLSFTIYIRKKASSLR